MNHDESLLCVCRHGRLFHSENSCDMCGCDGYLRLVVRCYACGRNLDRDPWPYGGFACWRPMPLNADQILNDRCPVCGSVFPAHECHGWDDW